MLKNYGIPLQRLHDPECLLSLVIRLSVRLHRTEQALAETVDALVETQEEQFTETVHKSYDLYLNFFKEI